MEQTQTLVFRQTGLHIEGSDIKNGIQDAVGKLSDPFLILEWSTGAGKSKACLSLCQGKKTLFLCKQEKHFQTWKDEIEKWDLHPSSYDMYCYQSLSKLSGRHYEIIVTDETHALTDARLKALKQLTWDRLIGLSATIPMETYQRLNKLGKPRVIRIPIAKAIEWQMIPIPRINVIKLPLDNSRKYLLYQRHQKRFGTTSTRIDFNQWNQYKTKWMNLDVVCTEKEYYSLLEEEFLAARKSFFEQPDCKAGKGRMCQQTEFFYNNFLQRGGMRKKFLSTIRTPIVKKLMEKLEGQRLVVFANSIEQCNILGEGYPVVHSQSKDKKVVEQFNSYELDKLFSVKQLDESMNLVGDFSAIVISLGGSTIQSLQRLGRSVRSDKSQMFLMLTPETRDDAYFKTFKEGLDESFFNYVKIPE